MSIICAELASCHFVRKKIFDDIIDDDNDNNIFRIMKVSLPDQLAYHAYIIQAAALASAEHFYSQNGGKRAATRRGKSARKRVRRSVEEIYHCLGPIE